MTQTKLGTAVDQRHTGDV